MTRYARTNFLSSGFRKPQYVCGSEGARGGQIQIKSNRHKNDFISNQSTHFFSRCQIKSNHDFRQNKLRQIKSNLDLIPISNQNFGCNQNQAIKRPNLWFHRQIWHRSKALSELFPSVPLVSPESTFWIKKWIDNDFANSNQIKSWEKGRQIKSNQITWFKKGVKSNQIT